MIAKKSVVPASTRPFIFSLLVISSWSVKTLHLGSHLRSLGPFDCAVLLPLLLLEDTVVAVLGRVLLARCSKRWSIFDAGFVGLVLAMITTVAAAMQVAFYWETSAEIDWNAAGTFMFDPEGVKLLLSGTNKVLVVLTLIAILAKVSASILYDAVGNGLRLASNYSQQQFGNTILCRQYLGCDDEEKCHREFSYEKIRRLSTNTTSIDTKTFCRKTYPFALAFLYVTVLAIYTKRTFTPYKHLMGSLPFTLIGDFERGDVEFCATDDNLNRRPFPLLGKTIDDGRYIETDWAPSEFMSGKGKPLNHVKWLPTEPIPGFQRWYSTGPAAESNHYDPRLDPLKISNTNSPVLETLQQAFQQNNVVIKNVMIITMESTRKDVFPFKQSSPLNDIILSSHEYSAQPELVELLANISRTAEILTGERSGFETDDRTQTFPVGTWRNLNSNMGGLNVKGAISSSTYTLKNLHISHCGVGSLPVDFGAEAFYDIYQPCLPQILGLFNTHKHSVDSQRSDDFRSQMWNTAYLQAATDQFDHQSTIMKKIGFSKTISREQLQDPESKFYPPTELESNYLGYSDAQLKPYVRDIIETARDNGRRFFISQLTSTTHYPWVLPAAFGEKRNYMGSKGWVNHETLNDYLNTIKYADVWLGEIMDMLEETGVANETLVVMAGDHGFAFVEDDLSYSVYDGAHISNFKIPLLFHHPHMPRVELSINASTMSILPTILDLLVSSNSLDDVDGEITSDLLNQYEGQSLLREFKTEDHGRQAWHISLMNPGGSFLAISSAAVPWRLVMPLCHTAMLRFTDLNRYEMEEEKLGEWSIEGLRIAVENRYGPDAARWVVDANAVGSWWFWETRRLWKFGGTSHQESPEIPEFLYERLNRTSLE